MKHVSISDAKDRFAALVREAEAGERIVVTRRGKPVIGIGPPTRDGGDHTKPRSGLNLEGLRRWKAAKGIDRIADYISDDFDDPLPADFLITPGPA